MATREETEGTERGVGGLYGSSSLCLLSCCREEKSKHESTQTFWPFSLFIPQQSVFPLRLEEGEQFPPVHTELGAQECLFLIICRLFNGFPVNMR